jgi:hypothetical protein
MMEFWNTLSGLNLISCFWCEIKRQPLCVSNSTPKMMFFSGDRETVGCGGEREKERERVADKEEKKNAIKIGWILLKGHKFRVLQTVCNTFGDKLTDVDIRRRHASEKGLLCMYIQ